MQLEKGGYRFSEHIKAATLTFISFHICCVAAGFILIVYGWSFSWLVMNQGDLLSLKEFAEALLEVTYLVTYIALHFSIPLTLATVSVAGVICFFKSRQF